MRASDVAWEKKKRDEKRMKCEIKNIKQTNLFDVLKVNNIFTGGRPNDGKLEIHFVFEV